MKLRFSKKDLKVYLSSTSPFAFYVLLFQLLYLMYGYLDFCIWGIANNYSHYTRNLFHRIAGVLKHLFWCLSQNQALSNGIGITVKQVLQCKKMSLAPIVLNDSLLPQNNLAVISYRCESGNINLVVLDKLLIGFWAK